MYAAGREGGPLERMEAAAAVEPVLLAAQQYGMLLCCFLPDAGASIRAAASLRNSALRRCRRRLAFSHSDEVRLLGQCATGALQEALPPVG